MSQDNKYSFFLFLQAPTKITGRPDIRRQIVKWNGAILQMQTAHRLQYYFLWIFFCWESTVAWY